MPSACRVKLGRGKSGRPNACQGGKNGREHGTFGKKVRLPDEPVGTMMVFRTFDRMSYALVMEATGDISVLTRSVTPKHRSTTLGPAPHAPASHWPWRATPG